MWQVCQTLAGQCTGDNKIILAHVEVGVWQVLQSGGLTKNVVTTRVELVVLVGVALGSFFS